MLDRLTVRRRFVRSLDPHLGYEAEVPPEDLPVVEPDPDPSPESQVGWTRPTPPGADIAHIEPAGLLEPTPWERRYVAWLAEDLGAEVAEGWDQPPAPHPDTVVTDRLREALTGLAPFATPADLPDRLRLVRGASRLVEARDAAAQIRAHLVAQPDPLAAADDVLVLLPSDAERIALWRRELLRADLPVRATIASPLAGHALAQWVLAIGDIAGWSADTPRRRNTIEQVLGARAWSAASAAASLSLPAGSLNRRALREAVGSLRRPSVDLTLWTEHLRSLADEADGDWRAPAWRSWAVLSEAVASALSEGSIVALRKTLLPHSGAPLQLGVRGAVRHGSLGSDVLERIVGALDRLEREAEGGVHPDRPLRGLSGVLEDAFASLYSVDPHLPQHGVTLLPFEQYDGRTSDRLVMAGLEEGGFPLAPALKTENDDRWLAHLGIATDRRAELERQVRVGLRALEQCRGAATLSFALEGEGTDVRHPGPLLSLLAGTWDDEAWRSAGTEVVDLPRSAELPRSLSEARCWEDVRLFGESDGVPEALHALDGSPDRLLAAAADLASSRLALAEREPAEDIDVGPWTGRLPGPTEPPRVYSATALEAYGQCGTRYLLGKILRLSDDEDAGEEPDPMQAGSLLHAAFAALSQDVVDVAVPTLLDFDVDPADPLGPEARVDSLLTGVTPLLRAALLGAADDAPTFSLPLLGRVADRWEQAVRRWLLVHVGEAVPHEVDGMEDLAPMARQQKIIDACVAQKARLDELQAGVIAETVKLTQGAWAAFGDRDAVSATALKAASKRVKAGESVLAVVDELRDARDAKEEGARLRLANLLAAERTRRTDHVARAAAHAELSFGFDRDPGPGEDPHSSADPVRLPQADPTFALRGQIDRVDWDTARGVVAVRDYKSGRKDSARKLQEKIGRGLHLQLLLYAEALQVLIDEGRLPHLDDARVGRVALEWLKGATGSASGSELDPREGSGWRLDGEELDLQQLGVAWARRHVEGIERGRFDLQPESCPMVESSARCDFERVCGFDPDTADRRPARLRLLLEEVPPPDEDEGGGDEPTQLPPLLPPIGDPDPDPAADRATHDAAQLVIADASKDAVVSAGAGTGKTWNLVRRYEAALDSVGDPQRILCVTFTRRAAGEMKARIRAQLLGRDDLDDAVLRGLVLELSSAPLWTLDALALRIVQEASAGAMPQVSEGGGLNADLQAFVSERFIEALDAGDDDLNLLLDHVAPAPARAALTAAVKAEFGEGFTDAAAVETLWEECAQPYLEAVRAFAEEIDATQGLHNVAAMKPDGKEALVERAVIALEACAALANPSARSATNPWPLVGHLKRMPGVSGLRQPLKRWIEESWVPAWAEFEAELGSRKKTFDALAKGADFGSWSEILAAAARLSSGWSADLREDLDRRGTLRYADVERRALEHLRDPALRQHLRARLPFDHVFVDEAQDTSARQVDLIHALRDLREPADRARLFWVGDPKQSIYRFRNAEVDVFEGLVGTGAALSLRTNRRSTPALIRSFNRLFSALLPATDGARRLDPGSEVTYTPLTWPQDTPVDPGPAIDLIATPGARWDVELAEEPEDDDESALDPTPLERATCAQIAALASDEADADHDGPPIAILVHSWKRADRYRDLLAERGVTAAVQGGRGLLLAPEVDGLLLWLEAAARRSDLGLVGALRGPGVAVSDAGLVCLRRGWGLVSPEDGAPPPHTPGLRRAATAWSLDPSLAFAAWTSAAGCDGSAADTLRLDAASLERFRGLWARFTSALTEGSVVGAVELLVDALHWESWWFARPGGRQAVANVAAFLQLIRETEAHVGSDGAGLLAAFDALRDADDPASGGLDAGHDVSVIITTYWQAKGLEWPIVVLPDLHKTAVKSEASPLGAARLVRKGSAFEVPELKLTDPERAPFSVHGLALTPLIDDLRMPALRAESRRLLYVAMTRAKSRLVLSGSFSAPDPGRAVPGFGEDKVYTLQCARTWADVLMTCTGLAFSGDGEPQLTSDLWTIEADVTLYAPDDLLPGLAPAPVPSTPPLPDLAALAPAWRPLPSPPLDLFLPSSAKSSSLPTPLGSPDWPAEDLDKDTPFGQVRHEGTAFHRLMELWGFGKRTLGRALAIEALDDVGMRPHPREAERIDLLLQLAERTVNDQPALVDRLRAAADRGELLHEVPLRFVDAGDRRVTGIVDLIWREDGLWHVIDYKAGHDVPQGLDAPILKKNHAQVEVYRDGLRALLGAENVGTTGLWYVACGLVVQWD